MSEMQPADMVYLKPTTKIEPLCARWMAWPHLISPVQHALNLRYRQMPILKSFIANPAMHAMAARDPKFLCAPFMHLPASDLAQLRSQLDFITSECGALLQFSEDLLEYHRLVRDDAKGFSLDELYSKAPPSLAGLFELTYDIDNHPNLRIIEELLYDVLPNAFTQELMFFDGPDADRHFFLNTPRIEAPDRIIVKLEFRDERVDMIARSRVDPISFERLAQALELDPDGQRRMRRFFTEEPPLRIDADYRGKDVRVRYFGHACVLVQTANTTILIDPTAAWERDDRHARLTFADLPDRIDHVLLTHGHQDHFSIEMLLQLRTRIGTVIVPRHNAQSIADPSLKLTLRSLGFDQVVAMDPLDTIVLTDGAITSLPFHGEHADLNINSKQGLLLELAGRKMLFLADSDCSDPALYTRLAPRVGKVDALFIGMECHGAPLSWLYGPYLPTPPARRDDESRRLSGSNCERAWAIVERVGCARAFIYAMGQEPWLKHLLGLKLDPESIQLVESSRFVQRCRDAGIESERLLGCREMLF